MPAENNKVIMKDPQSHVRALALIGSSVKLDPHIPLRRYFRSSSQMLRMAKMYLDEKQLENAFILYTKYFTLFIEKVPKHPEYASIPPEERACVSKQKLESVFSIAENVKALILEDYTKKYEKWLVEKEKQEEEERLRLEQEALQQEKEKKIREEFEIEKARRLAEGREALKMAELSLSDNSSVNNNENLNDELIPKSLSRNSIISPSPSISSGHSLPGIEKNIVPSVDRSTKPRSLFSPGPDTSNVYGLRTIVVPISGIEIFLRLAKSNTERNIETCGILAGIMSHNQLVITHLLIPKQTGTSDSCTTDNEEDIFIHQDKYNLITLGWIHTHPSQTSFMSSVDLHTHCSYQLMMPEAVAIVSSPKYHETKIFSLTPDYGLDYIARCQQKGFHPHPNEPVIYEESVHAKLDEKATISIVDLRK